jgi:ammonium transporter
MPAHLASSFTSCVKPYQSPTPLLLILSRVAAIFIGTSHCGAPRANAVRFDSVSAPLPVRRARRLSVPKEAIVSRKWLLALAATTALLISTTPARAEGTAKTADPGHTAWMLVATAFVMLMVPGLALFYGGMVRRKNVLATMMQSMVALAIVGVFWIAFGYGLAFGRSYGGIIGWDNRFFFLAGVQPKDLLPGTDIPIYLHAMYQGMFAIITPALISGAIAERIRFKPYCLFLIVWSAVVYCPLAHWVWAMDWWTGAEDAGTHPVGWLGKMGALDFAGGTVVHVAAGLSGLAAILVLRKRIGYPEHAMHPNSMVLTLLGGGLLWFGWFGFNGGSGLQSGSLAVSAFSATQAAAAAAALTWMLAEWWHKGKPTALGVATGLVAGLVAVTPASGFVYPWGGLAIGAIAALVCYGAVCLKPRFGYDDSLDAFGVHGVGGFVGAILTGVFCYVAINDSGANGLIAAEFRGDGFKQVGIQIVAAVSSVVFTLGMSLILIKVIDQLMGFTVDSREETEGLDRTEHGEVGFDLGLALESVPEAPSHEPRAAMVPPNGVQRFTVIVEGADAGELKKTWSELCGAGSGAPPAEFKAVYPYMTTMQGNRFRFRGGDPKALSENLRLLLNHRLSTPIQVYVEH